MTTDSETTVRTAVPDRQATAEGVNARSARGRAREAGTAQTAPETTPTSLTQRHRGEGFCERLVDQLAPPQPWTHRPASLQAMARYARRGGWTGPDGAARRLGVWWYWLVAIPVTLLCHYTAWIIARPSRTVVTVTVWTVAMQVPPLRAAAAVILPWNPWPIGGG
jgi:hypothetical protein